MNNSFAATYKKLFGDSWLLWYEKSNSYSIIDNSFKTHLDYYFQSSSEDDFIAKVKTISNESINGKTLTNSIYTYLKGCNKVSKPQPKDLKNTIDTSKRSILKQYLIDNKCIKVYYCSELVSKIIHPSLEHLATNNEQNATTTFDIYLKGEELFLYKNEQLITLVPKRDYHFIQGKFIMHLLSTIHNKKESDWVGTLHGSTITRNNSSILFLGKSGKGKSTLCALLTANGFDLLADDISPLLSENSHIYYNPSAISIKKGAFDVLQPIIDTFDSLPITEFNATKGSIKYLPCNVPEKKHYPCKAAILVNYEENSDTLLEKVSIQTLLETLIPDSWLSPSPIHAKQFLEWLYTLEIYSLTYSDTKSVVNEISDLFKKMNKN